MKEIRYCPKHGETFFTLRRTENRFRCNKCCVDAVTKRRKSLKLKAIQYKGGKCEICSYDKCVEALEFHHLDPLQKDFAIAAYGHTSSWDKVRVEVDKCMLLCANCHREVHAAIIVI